MVSNRGGKRGEGGGEKRKKTVEKCKSDGGGRENGSWRGRGVEMEADCEREAGAAVG